MTSSRTLLPTEEDRGPRRLLHTVSLAAELYPRATVLVATVEPFIAQLAAFLVGTSIDASAAGDNLLKSVEAERAASREQLWRIKRGERPIEVMYPWARDVPATAAVSRHRAAMRPCGC